jgi:hypothetical protein
MSSGLLLKADVADAVGTSHLCRQRKCRQRTGQNFRPNSARRATHQRRPLYAANCRSTATKLHVAGHSFIARLALAFRLIRLIHCGGLGRMTGNQTRRKIVAILASDVVGYSRLAGADEDRTLARLRALRSDLIDPIIAVHHGRVSWTVPSSPRSISRLGFSRNGTRNAFRRRTASSYSFPNLSLQEVDRRPLRTCHRPCSI